MRCSLLAVGLLMISSLGAFAENAPAPSAKDPEATVDQLAGWLNGLLSEEFQVRQNATESLEKAGQGAVEALQSLAEGNNLEAAIRSLTVLERMSRSDDEAASRAAREALESLTMSAQPVVAQRARAALANGALPNALPNAPLGLRMLGQQVRGGGRQVQMRVVNGKREVTIKEQDREVHFSDENGKNITVEVIKTVDGKKKSEKFQVKDVDELRKKDPDLAKLFEQNGNMVQINVAMGVLNAGAVPRLVMPNGKAVHADIERALSKLKELETRIEGVKPESAAEDLKQLQEDIDAVRKELHAAQAKLE